MSLNVPKLHVTKVMDPRLEINRQKDYVVLKGAQVNSWQQYFATNFNNSSVQITAIPPSRLIAISRLVFKRFQFIINITGTNTTSPAANLLQPGYYGPRAYPLLSCTASEQMQINNDTLTQSPVYQYWPTIMWYHNNFHSRFGQLSLTPSMLDQSQNVLDAAGSIRNPLASYFDNSYEQTRGGYFGMVVTSNTPTAATIVLTITEPIFISPFVAGECSNYSSAFIGVNNMNYTCTFGNLARIMELEVNQGTLGSPSGLITINPITNNNITLTAASLLFEFLTPDPLVPIPKQLETSYFSLVSYPTQYQGSALPPYNPAAPTQISITMQSVQLTSIPRRLYIFGRRDDSLQTEFTTDSYLSLPQLTNPLTVTWNNNQFFSQATTQDLFNISCKNGYMGSYSQFTNYSGSVICIDLSTDLGLYSDEAPSLIGTYQLGLTCQFVNTNPTQSITLPTLYVVVVYEGTFNIIDGNSSHMIGVLSRNDILNAEMNPFVTYKKTQQVFGGDFFSKLKGFAKGAHNFIKKGKVLSSVADVIPHPAGRAASAILRNFGYGARGGNLENKGDLDKPLKMNNKDIKQKLIASDLMENEYEESQDLMENEYED